MQLIFNHKSNLTYNEIIKYEKKLRKYNVIVLPSTCFLPFFNKGKYINYYYINYCWNYFDWYYNIFYNKF